MKAGWCTGNASGERKADIVARRSAEEERGRGSEEEVSGGGTNFSDVRILMVYTYRIHLVDAPCE